MIPCRNIRFDVKGYIMASFLLPVIYIAFIGSELPDSLFPNFNYLAPESFGKDVSESVFNLHNR